ncbi:fatty acyl-AMP ligase [Nitrospirillum sp. BR 11828]|uniref:fatty acyl-AMP ligase n=1 Tax=Nitrospirillum sp. BR 11828 TaxID=3104325 RepID=UPI002ACA7D9B|nr:fatty acyl-AMP ligase [Nitrospirillum sp. BR 11828]MDZ5649762.1 fatty acyl-AMP ligase [Nitrospirillum sp. BR 11828]
MDASLSDARPERSVGKRHASLGQVLRHHADAAPDKIALRFLERGEGDGACLTYAELDRQVQALAARLVRKGAQGRTVLLVYPAGISFIVGFYACLYAGAIAVPTPFITPSRSAHRIAAIATDASPCLVLTCAALAADEAIRGAFPAGLSDIPWMVTDGEESPDDTHPWTPVAVQAGDPAFLQYTSGSTANPRGVVVTHGNLLATMEMIRVAFGHDADTRMVSWLPLFHDMGLVGGLLQPLYVGGLAVLMSPLDFIQRPLRWLQAIARHGATSSGGPNFAYALCADRIRPEQVRGLDLRSWRVAFCGAEPVRADDLRRFAEGVAPAGFDPKALFPCYGLAEATLFVSGGPVGRGLACAAAPGAYPQADGAANGMAKGIGRVICGQGADGQVLAIVDPDSRRRVPEGQVGEVWVAGPHVGAGYWRQWDQSQATFRARLSDDADAGPFLRTGDLGLMRGRDLVIVGRLKEVVIVRGAKHHPEDMEAAACRAHPALAGTAAAFAVEHGGADGLVVLQEVKRGHLADPDLERALQAVSAAICETFGMRPLDVVLLRPGALPRTTSNKIRRGACREAYLAGDLAPFRLDPPPRPGNPGGLHPGRRSRAHAHFPPACGRGQWLILPPSTAWRRSCGTTPIRSMPPCGSGRPFSGPIRSRPGSCCAAARWRRLLPIPIS